MREFKIFAVLIIFTAIVYWGVEPYAHSQMHEHTSAANFDFKALDLELANKELAAAQASGKADEIAAAKAQLAAYTKLYENVAAIKALKGDAEAGRDDFAACAGCHRAEAAGFADVDDEPGAQGIVVPDLSTAGAIYSEDFLRAIMINPALAMKNHKKFNDENPHPMVLSFADEEGNIDDEGMQSIANITAFLREIGQKALMAKEAAAAAEINASKLSDVEKSAALSKARSKIYFEEACGRCHDVKYDNFFARVNGGDLKEYMGSTPPDLSIIIRAKGAEYLHKFINDTQKQLPGTAMPRVGLTEAAQGEVVAYLEAVGDSKKAERESLGLYIMGFFVLLALVAYGWKSAVWRELH